MVSSLLVATGIVATLLSFGAAPVESDSAHSWAAFMPIAYLGLVGLRRAGVLLLTAGLLFGAVAAVAGIVLLRMNHLSAGFLIDLGVLGAVEAVVFFARHWCRHRSTIR